MEQIIIPELEEIKKTKRSFRSRQEKILLVKNGLCVICATNPIKRERKCIECNKAYEKKRRLDKINDIIAGDRTKLRAKYEEIRKDAKKRGREFNLSFEFVTQMLTGKCYYCGISGKLGLDRVDNAIGYVNENVVAACKTCNFAKRFMSVVEFYDWIDRVYRFIHGMG